MKHLLLIVALLCMPAFASLSEITGAECVNTAGASCTLGSHAFGDLEVTFSYRSASSTAPLLPVGYTNINNGGVSNSTRTAYRFLTGAETVTGTFTNATSVTALVFRGADIQSAGPIGGNALGGATSTSVAYNTLTMTRGDGTSWVVGFDGCASCTANNNAPTGMTLREGGGANKIAASSTAGGVSSWTTTTVTVTTSGLWRSQTVEILASPAKTAVTPVQVVHAGHMGESGVKISTLTLPLPNSSLSNNLLLLAFSACGQTTTLCDTNPPSITSVKDNNNTTWTAGATVTDSTDHYISNFYYCAGCTAGVKTITVTYSSSIVADFQWDFVEVNGIATASPSDGSAGAVGTGQFPGAGSITPSTSGDLLVSYCVYVSNDIGNGNPLTHVYLPSGSTRLEGDVTMASGMQAFFQTTAAAYATFFEEDGSVGQNSNCLVQAFKASAGSGSAGGAGTRIGHLYYQFTTGAAQQYIEPFDSLGNLIFISSTDDTNTLITAASDAASNTYSFINGGTGYPTAAYTTGAATASPLWMKITQGTSTEWYMIYDVVNGGVFDTKTASPSCTQTGSNPITESSFITPSQSNGIVFTPMAFGTGPASSISAPSGAFFDCTDYTSMSDINAFCHGDAQGHYFNPNTTAETWTWQMANGAGGSSCAPFGVSFTGPAAAAKVCTIGLMGAGPC